MGKKFVWKFRSGYTRKGVRMEYGSTYDADNFDPETVKEWIRTKANEFTSGSKKQGE